MTDRLADLQRLKIDFKEASTRVHTTKSLISFFLILTFGQFSSDLLQYIVRGNPGRTWNSLGQSIFGHFWLQWIVLTCFQASAKFFTQWLFFNLTFSLIFLTISKMPLGKKATR